MNDTFRVIVLVFFATHIPATVMMDSQAIVPPRFVPRFAKNVLDFHIDTNHDPLMDDQPIWFKTFILFELLFQLPFFFVGFKAFNDKQNWIRIPGIVYGTHTATTLLPILGEILFSTDIPNDAARIQLFLIYLPYLVIPFMMALILAPEEKPFGKEGGSSEIKGKAKKK